MGLNESLPEREFWRIPELAQKTGIHPNSLYRLISQKRLPVVRVGRTVLVRKSALEEVKG